MKGLQNLLGLWKRQRPVVGASARDVVFAENKWKLLRYVPRPGPLHRTPVLLVPSLINRHYVLDLMPGKSFTEYLVGQGYEVFCIDWGCPTDEDRFVTFDDIVDQALGRALRRIGRKVHLLGYCMGGTLAAIHAALHPGALQSLVALAAPVRFDGDSLMERWVRSKSFDPAAVVEGCGTVPAALMQSAFHLLRPTLPLSKAVMLLDRAWNDEFLDGFLALETWGNDNVALPGEFFRTYVSALYREDALMKGTLRVSGQAVRLSDIRCPTLAVTFGHDNIVPRASAAALVGEGGVGGKRDELHLPGGHVGAVVSKHAAKTLWPVLSDFFAAHARVEKGPRRAAAAVSG